MDPEGGTYRSVSPAEFERYYTNLVRKGVIPGVFAKHGPWPFGAIVKHVGFDALAMVLTDDGILCKVLMLGHGEIVETGRSIWEWMDD